MTQAAKLDHEITIERKTSLIDPDYGTEIGTEWSSLVMSDAIPPAPVRLRAEVQDLLPSRQESLTQDVTVARYQTRIRLRYRADIDSSMRVIVHRDTDITLQIVGGPVMIGRKELTELMCERYTS